MPGYPRNETIRLSQRQKILKLRLEGYDQIAIAEMLNASQPTISRALKRINEDLEVTRSPRLEWVRQMSILEGMVDELMESWEASKADPHHPNRNRV
jgi:DNA-binding CsgD family transcriptional regulator